jgi:predicted nuclease with TOPRIM domain
METPYGIKKPNLKMKTKFLNTIQEEDQILLKLDSIEEKLDRIEEKLKKNTEDCEKMSEHIDFVENVYSTLKSPLEFIRWKLGYSQENLPQVKNV